MEITPNYHHTWCSCDKISHQNKAPNARVTHPVTHLTVIQQNKDINDFNEDLIEDKCEFFPVSLNRW